MFQHAVKPGVQYPNGCCVQLDTKQQPRNKECCDVAGMDEPRQMIFATIQRLRIHSDRQPLAVNTSQQKDSNHEGHKEHEGIARFLLGFLRALRGQMMGRARGPIAVRAARPFR